MHNYTEVRGKFSNNVDVFIRSVHSDANLDESFYAINWFSTKMEWLYHFYNFLAVRSVLKVGGKPFFKAKVTETLVDDNRGRRDLLLIVNYPNGKKFISLMESTYFKMVSIFRILSVKRFTFGLTQKLAIENESQKSDDLSYAIHHFKVATDSDDVLQKIQSLIPADVSIKYTGQMIANLYSQGKGKEPDQIPNLMDGLVIYQSNSAAELKSFLESKAYQGFRKTFASNHISLLNRIF